MPPESTIDAHASIRINAETIGYCAGVIRTQVSDLFRATQAVSERARALETAGNLDGGDLAALTDYRLLALELAAAAGLAGQIADRSLHIASRFGLEPLDLPSLPALVRTHRQH